MSAGYSGRPLAQKLGIKSGFAVSILNAPDHYDVTLGDLPDGVTVSRRLSPRSDLIQIFVIERSGLEKELPKLKRKLKEDGMIWVSWPKRSSGLNTDLSDVVVRRTALEDGLVDVKVCAVDEVWSALKFVRRLRDRDPIIMAEPPSPTSRRTSSRSP